MTDSAWQREVPETRTGPGWFPLQGKLSVFPAKLGAETGLSM